MEVLYFLMPDVINTPPSGNGDNILSLSLPQKEGKAGYLTSFLIARNEIIGIIKNSNSGYDRRIIFAVKALIGFIDEDEYRYALYKKFNDRVSEINAMVETGADERSDMVMDEALFLIGEITSYFDRVIGLSHGLEVRLL